MNSTKKNDIKYGKEDLLVEDEFDPKYAKVRISLMVDLETVQAFKKKAKESGQKYQVLMRNALRESIDNQNNLAERVKKIEGILDPLMDKLFSDLELKEIIKKKA